MDKQNRPLSRRLSSQAGSEPRTPIVYEGFEDFAAKLFQPDVLVAARYLDGLKGNRSGGVEKLMFVVLQDAIDCIQRYLFAQHAKDKETFRDAERWIWEQNCNGIFSFVNICETLGYDPGYLRRGLYLRKQTHLKTGADLGIGKNRG